MITWIFAAGVAIILSAIFAACDVALLTVSKARVDELVKEEKIGARTLQEILVETPRLINLLNLLRVVGEIFYTIIIFHIFLLQLRFGYALALSLIVITLINYIFNGVGPRTLGRQHAYAYACFCAAPMRLLVKIFHPLTQILIILGNALTPGVPLANGPFASEVELREMVDLAQKGGALDADERKMIQAVFDLNDNNVRSVMVPRTEMVWVEETESVNHALSTAVLSGYSRIPVIGEDLDDIVGVLYVKDLVSESFKRQQSFAEMTSPLRDLMRQPQFLPDMKPLDDALEQMQSTRTHIAFLVNEYGSIAGLVTLEDIVEEIVGEITDEYDREEITPIVELAEGQYRLSARLSLEDLGELFDIDFEIEEYEDVDTILGLVALELERIPLPGMTIQCHGLEITTEGGKDRRGRIKVKTLLVSRLAAGIDDEPEKLPRN